MLNKRLIILISIITGIVFFAILILWLLFRTPTAEKPPVAEQPTEEEITPPITPPKEEEFAVFKLSDVAAISPTISGNKVLYYSKLNGNVYETDFKGEETQPKTNINITDLITTIWSRDKTKAINIYKENEVVKKVFFDFATKKATQLDSRIKWASFASDKDRIAYQFVDESLGTNKIAVADPNGLNFQSVFPLRMADVRVYWPSEDIVAFATAPSGLVPGAAFSKTVSNPEAGLTKLVDNANGLTIKYSTDGSRLLYSKTDQFGHSPTLSLIKDGATDNLNINTISDKCAFSQNNNIYCAVPRLINGSLVLPDDFYKNTANFSDIFFKIDAAGNRSSIIFDPADLKYDFNATDISISSNEDYLIFVNKKDGLLYSIKIK